MIVDGLFKGMEGFIADVNRSNERINFEVTLMVGKLILSLSYQEIQKYEKFYLCIETKGNHYLARSLVEACLPGGEQIHYR